MNFTIFIPTYNREKDLEKCLFSITKQTLLPNEILIIDDGDILNEFIIKWKNNLKVLNIDLIYYKKDHTKERRGLAESKNIALENIKNKILFILDDDVILLPDFCENIIKVWEKNDSINLIGVGGIIKNRRKKIFFEKFYYNFFGIRSKYSWDVNRIGFQIWDEEIKYKEIGFYTHGGVCSYNTEKAKKIGFAIFDGGRTGLEDVDFCLQAKKRGFHFIIEPKAELFHYPNKSNRENQFRTGYKESKNRKIIFKKESSNKNLFIYLWFLWASIGWLLRQLIVGNFSKFKGSLYGFLEQ